MASTPQYPCIVLMKDVAFDRTRGLYHNKHAQVNPQAALRENARSSLQFCPNWCNDDMYFEIKIFSSQSQCPIFGIGLAPDCFQSGMVGWIAGSIGYHGDDGNIFNNNGSGERMVAKFGVNDVIGCGYSRQTGSLFFTKNGRLVVHPGIYNRQPYLNLIPTITFAYGEQVMFSVNIQYGKFVYAEMNRLPAFLQQQQQQQAQAAAVAAASSAVPPSPPADYVFVPRPGQPDAFVPGGGVPRVSPAPSVAAAAAAVSPSAPPASPASVVVDASNIDETSGRLIREVTEHFAYLTGKIKDLEQKKTELDAALAAAKKQQPVAAASSPSPIGSPSGSSSIDRLLLTSEEAGALTQEQLTSAKQKLEMSMNNIRTAQEEKELCVICMDAKRKMLFLPCKHLICCDKCTVGLVECPLCRTKISEKLNVFM